MVYAVQLHTMSDACIIRLHSNLTISDIRKMNRERW